MRLEHTIEIDGREVAFDVQVSFTPATRGCEETRCRGGHGRPEDCYPGDAGECAVLNVGIGFAHSERVTIPMIFWPILFGPNFERDIAEKAAKQYEESNTAT